ncbi:unnamed protein product [Coccothraustes coccothraustes]
MGDARARAPPTAPAAGGGKGAGPPDQPLAGRSRGRHPARRELGQQRGGGFRRRPGEAVPRPPSATVPIRSPFPPVCAPRGPARFQTPHLGSRGRGRCDWQEGAGRAARSGGGSRAASGRRLGGGTRGGGERERRPVSAPRPPRELPAGAAPAPPLTARGAPVRARAGAPVSARRLRACGSPAAPRAWRAEPALPSGARAARTGLSGAGSPRQPAPSPARFRAGIAARSVRIARL